MSSLEKNQTCFLPAGKTVWQNWIFRVEEEKNERRRCKAQLVLNIVASEDLHLEQLDVKSAFLHEYLEEDIYMA